MTKTKLRGWHARGETGSVIVNFVGFDANGDNSAIELTAIRLCKGATLTYLGTLPRSGATVVVPARRSSLNFHGAMRKIAARNRGNRAWLQRETYPNSKEQTENHCSGRSRLLFVDSCEHGVLVQCKELVELFVLVYSSNALLLTDLTTKISYGQALSVTSDRLPLGTGSRL